VVDDDQATAALFRRVAERAGHTVRTAASAAEARARVSEELPEVVVLDMVMPEVDGIEMVGWFAQQGFRGRVVLVSGFAETYLQAAAAMARARGIGDVQILTKPVEIGDLRAALAG
jgi:CheY-like chemotaxis protein